jgi:A/G-specific adenine glycosylase
MSSVSRLRSRLLAWYDVHRRDLPWRAGPGQVADAYRVWLSEVMLQQTTVPHATRYFLDFTSRWPTVETLAAAADADVMAAWAGLGYYARARNLLACARAVVADHAGRFPDDEAGLRALPGLGAYAAAAVAAIAFDRRANVVDGNVERVMARLFAVETPLPAGRAQLRVLADGLVTDDRPGDWAQALMDLGAMICRPRSPACLGCPLGGDCAARASGAPETWPRKTAKAARPHRHGVAYVLWRGDAVALVRRPAKGLLGGMLGLPTTPWRSPPWTPEETSDHAPCLAEWRAAGGVTHVFTHFSLDLDVRVAEADVVPEGVVWTARSAALTDTPSLFRKALERAFAFSC